MEKIMIAVAAASAVGSALAGVYGDIPDAKHAWAVHDMNRPKPAKVEPAKYVPTGVPSDAVVLFDGTAESLAKNWRDGKGGPTGWKLGTEGDFYCVPGWKNGGSIVSRAEFGDCQLHLEFRHDLDVGKGNPGAQMRGNSGVFLMGNYEIQILESYYTSREMEGKDGFVQNYADGQAGSVYAENPPMVNPQRKPGEWQTYDIIFHQPVWQGKKLLHPGSVTVLFNGVVVQDHWEMEGLTTHAVRRPLAPHKMKGPLSFQDHGCTVHFRNIWYRPLPSRWDNKTHSTMSADETEVMKLRRETAAKLYAKIKDPHAVTINNLKQLGEVISYCREGEQLATWKEVSTKFHDVLDQADEKWWKAHRGDLMSLKTMLEKLIRGGAVPADCGTRKRIADAAERFGWNKKK